MVRSLVIGTFASTLVATQAALAGGWVTYANETSARILAPGSIVTSDTQEKDYAWGDLDMDGDDDLVIVRKQPFTTGGRDRNVLLMNEGGVLVDRTNDFATAADDGGLGFLDLTNDRDVVLADVNDDGWLDVVTATACNGCGGLPKTITHPRVYINLQNDGGGNWLGLFYEEARIPQAPQNPNYCAVAAGDVTGDLIPDLYFVDYNSSLEDRLLINDGNGNFTDESEARMTLSMRQSGFGTAARILDMNGDNWNDIVKSENGPVKIINNGGNGFFDILDNASGGAHYHVSTADLNKDGMFDLIISDDGTDRTMINVGNGGNGMADFTQVNLPELPGGQGGGFGSDSLGVDLDNDTNNDVIIADVDVDLSGCNRVTHIYRNNGALPIPGFVRDFANIPQAQLQGVHDVAAIDVDNDDNLDLVVGRCTGTQVWMNAPPVAIEYEYPNGLPNLIQPEVVTAVQVQLTAIGDSLVVDSPTLHLAVNGGKFAPSAMTPLGGGMYEFVLPAGECSDRFDYYISAELAGGLVFSDPPAAPAAYFTSVVSDASIEIFSDDMEGDTSGWTVVNDRSLTAGAWEPADPNGTIVGGNLAAPEDDASPLGSVAFVTQNGTPGGAPGAADVDGGPTRLLSPIFDLTGTDAFISYSRWAFSAFDVHDALIVEISNDAGASWTVVESVADTASSWEQHTILVSAFVDPTDQMQMRFSISDLDLSVTEGGVDDFSVNVVCGGVCEGDLNGDNVIGTGDLLDLLAAWGPNPDHPADLDNDGIVGTSDLLELLANWGPCGL